MAGTPIHVEETLNKLRLETFTVRRKGIYILVLAAEETLLLPIVRKVVKSPELVSRFLDVVIDNP